jgi:hypothetical protein
MSRIITPPTPPRKSSLRERVARLRRYLPSFPPSSPSPETEGVWARARRDTGRIKKTWLARGIVVVIELATLVIVEEVLVSANRASVRVAVLILLVAAVPLAAIGVVYVFQAVRAPFRQRREWRAQLATERNEAKAHLDAELRSARAQIAREREAFDKQVSETERIRGLLGEAEEMIREFRARGATLASEIPNIVGRLIDCWEDKGFDNPSLCKFHATIEVTNREHLLASVRFALVFASASMHTESEQKEPPIRLEGRTTERVTVHFLFPEMFVGPFRSADGGPPEASVTKLTIRELVSDTESTRDVRP